jgi:kumamolisin
MSFSLPKTRQAATALGMIGALTAFSGTAFAAADTLKTVDLGSVAERAGDQTISVTVALKLNNLAGAEALMSRLATQGDPLYQKFLTPEQVQAQFGPAEADVDKVIASLRLSGLTVERTGSTTLKATGSTSTMERVFQTSLHQFLAASAGKGASYTFRAPLGTPVVPTEIAPLVQAVVGLSTQPVFHSHFRQAPTNLGGVAIQRKKGGAPAPGNAPGFLTVTDFAALYDVQPLYNQGVSGKGQTLAIVTLANFTPSDVFTYWNSLNLKVDPNRLTVDNIDGGPGAPSDASGSDETTLDVEQSGGIAPGAKIIVYQAPNTSQGFLDAFAAAIQSNKAESISTSWGEWEFFDNLANSPVTDPFSGETVSALQATHELFVEAALQGQSLFAAAGDCGAYDVFDEVPAGFTTPLSVDYPGSDTAMTSAGGTTLPGMQSFTTPTGTVTVNVPTERVWGWDYLEPLCTALGLDPVSCGIFPVGGGGGVSVFFSIPLYQFGIAGTQVSQPGQTLIDDTQTPPETIFKLPARFAGRNVPDLSFNADPETGYVLDYTSDVHGFSVETFGGGTSFVAPQLNGVTALLNQNAGHRLGLLNIPLYTLSRLGLATQGPVPVLNNIAAGDNWFYSGRKGYSPAAGLGTLNVSNLARVTR